MLHGTYPPSVHPTACCNASSCGRPGSTWQPRIAPLLLGAWRTAAARSTSGDCAAALTTRFSSRSSGVTVGVRCAGVARPPLEAGNRAVCIGCSSVAAAAAAPAAAGAHGVLRCISRCERATVQCVQWDSRLANRVPIMFLPIYSIHSSNQSTCQYVPAAAAA